MNIPIKNDTKRYRYDKPQRPVKVGDTRFKRLLQDYLENSTAKRELWERDRRRLV